MEIRQIHNSLLINGDALNIISSIKNQSVDCVITDPPYFINGMGSDWSNRKLRASAKKASVIGALPVGMKFDPEQGKALQQFIGEISKEIYRVLKPGGFYLSFSQGRLYHRMCVAIEDAGFEIRDMLVWYREGQGKAFTQNHFVRKMNISEDEKKKLIESMGNRKTPQLKGQSEPIVLAQKPKCGTFVKNWQEYGVGLIDTSVSLDGKTPGTVMRVPKPHGEERKESKHLTLKPVTLMKHLVNIFTKEGDIVFDPFMGSGTTGVATEETNRFFVGIEIAPESFQEACVRCERHKGSMPDGLLLSNVIANS